MPKPAALKLKKTLDRDQGRNYKLEKQKKLQKEAEKRKRQKQRSEIDVDALEHAISDEEVEEEVQSAAERKKESKAAKKAAMAEAVNGEADGWETEESQDAEDEDAEDAEGGAEVEGEMEDESESDSELGDNDVDEDDEDIPLSDIESLASEDRADVIPHQRLTINNTAALQRSLKSFALPSSLPFSANQTVVSTEPVQIADVDDDLNRELAFYRQSLDAVTEARSRLKKEGVPFSRPTDYFAEMVKSEEQMGKVRAKMLDEAARKKASADARRQRDLKKFGKAVQVAKLQERQKEKTKTLDRIQTLKRSKSRRTMRRRTFTNTVQNDKEQTSQPTKTTDSTSHSKMPQQHKAKTEQRSAPRALQMVQIGRGKRRMKSSASVARRDSRRVTTQNRRTMIGATRRNA